MLLFLLACAEPPPKIDHMSDLYHPILQLNTGAVPGGTEQFQLLMHPEMQGICHPLDAMAATFDGKPLTRLHGKVEGGAPYDRDCAVFEFALGAGEVPGANVVASDEVTVTDGVETYRMVVTNLYAPRVLTLTSPATVKAGDPVTMSWSPATDVVAAKGKVGFELRAGDKRVVVPRKDVTFAPGSIQFVLPPGIDGDVTATLFGTDAIQPAVATCEGAFACAVSRSYSVPPFALSVLPAPPAADAAAPPAAKGASAKKKK
jgi:hypothetical protein